MFIFRLHKTLFTQCMMIVCLAGLATTAQAGNRWDWAEMTAEQELFCDTYMPPFIELRKSQGDEAALKELDRLYDLAEKQFGSTFFFHRVVWYEAQVHSGKEDEEWGLTLYEYILEHDIKNNSMRKCACKFHASDYILYGNIMGCCTALGKAAKAREYCLMVEESLLRDRKFDLTGASYADRGPVFTFLDEARKRDYPIFKHQMRPDHLNEDERDFIFYPNIYALNYVAEIAMRSGDWVKAAELSEWSMRYGDEYMVDQTLMAGEVNRECSSSTRKRLSDLAMLHGYPEESIRFLKNYIALAENYNQAGQTDLLKAKLDLAVIRIKTGELTDDALALADEAEESISENLYYDRVSILMGSLNKARVYHALGHTQEAWETVDGLLKTTAEDVNPYHWVQVLGTAIDLALADGATRPELEAWLVLALDNARLTGNKFEELPLYEKYARFLTMKGRYAEAAQIQQEAVRLSRAMNLPKRMEDNAAILADLDNELDSRSVDQVIDTHEAPPAPLVEAATNAAMEVAATTPPDMDQPAGGTTKPALVAVDVQPRLSLSASLQGQAAYGRFYVHNPSFADRKGKLCLTGPIDQIQWRNEQWLTVSASPVFENVNLTRSILLEAGASCIIDITGLPLENGAGAEVRCQWIPEDRQTTATEGAWSYLTAETEKRTAVIDAHELQDNPFYLIPINHMVQRVDATGRQIVDYTVEASSPMRIESYDGATGRLLAIDANGDGDFLDIGDLIVGDDNRNNWPDLVFVKNEKLSSLVMYVQPGNASSPGAEVELTIKTRTNGEWQTDAVDVIKPYRPAER